MGNVIDSFASGFGEAVGKLFNSPLEFLSGKSCSSVCGPTWDFFCYIENFCVANLLKLGVVFVLLYIVLLFFYVLHKLGVFRCLCYSACKITWACCSTCFHIWEYSCTFLCAKLHNVKRKRRRRRVRMGMNQKVYSTSEEDYVDESLSYDFPTSEISRSVSRRRRDYKGSHLRKSLKPKRGHAQVEISRDLSYNKNRRNHSSRDHNYTSNADIKHTGHEIKVTQTSKFARKGMSNRKKVVRRQRK
ncbi:uncharacterized protein LOC127082834 [Lathyrus oleraceus]|uniref:Uncharacterized protein n=1 Tax=Pisum sativum TaxID=3888 RepID=A0A9D5AC75_PEA|nr:uncharacterized protein LOC127082834 [Pisum sativum]KAI5405952.1 hypothetical protein KIW84_052633 [Pisum sativum]